MSIFYVAVVLTMNIDLEKLAEYKVISLEDLMNKKLSEVINLKKEMEEKREEEEVKNDIEMYPLDIKKKYLRNYQGMVKVFGDTVVNTVIKKIPFKKLSTQVWTLNRLFYDKQGYIFVKEGIHSFDVAHRGASSYSRKESKHGYCFYAPSTYQSLIEPTIIKQCLILKMGNSFDVDRFSIYSFEGKEIYLNVGNGKTLYIPLINLINKDIDGIKERNTSYQNKFYHDVNYCNNLFDNEKVQSFFDELKK